MDTRYESQSGVLVDDPTEHDLDQLLGTLDGVDNTFASLTTRDGSYVQVGGGPTEFTVEMRKVSPKSAFRHLKAALPNGSRDVRQLNIGGVRVSVRTDQVLDLATVRQ